MADMMREGLRFAHQGFENKKADPWHQVGYRLRERCLVRHLAVTHIRACARSTVAAPGPVGRTGLWRADSFLMQGRSKD